MFSFRQWPLAAALAAYLGGAGALPADDQATAETILRQAGVSGGMIVHVGCGTGELTAGLGARPGFTVQGLDTDPITVAAARGHIAAQGRYGRVSADVWDGRHLPYADNLVNLLVAESAAAPETDEMLRVLAPGGVAMVRRDGRWTRTVKPRPGEIDAWTHYLHGPGNNAVADDAVVGPPQRVQWISGPPFARSHEFNSSLAAMVSSGERIFYIWDEGPIGVVDPRLPSTWSLMARDAFNGALLWKRPMPEWGWRQWHAAARWDDPRERARMLRHLPPVLPRRLVAAGDRLFVTLGYDAPVTVLDGATGKVLRVLEGTAPTDEILHAGDGLLVLAVREGPPEGDIWDSMPEGPVRSRIAVVDASDGTVRWRSEPVTLAPLSLAVREGRVFYSTYEEVVCRNLDGGEQRWRNASAPSRRGHRNTGGTLVVHEQTVLYAPYEPKMPGGRLHAFCAQAGELLWRTERGYHGPGISNPPDVFVADGLVWLGETRIRATGLDSATDVVRQGRDPRTGDVVRTVAVDALKSPGHHYRCYRSKATERFLLLPKRGVEFLDLTGDEHMRHDWLRAPCIYGVVPANGMLYVPPHQCVCYPGVLHSNFNALIARADAGAGPSEPPPAARLERGPAWPEDGGQRPEVGGQRAEDGGQRAEDGGQRAEDEWPTYRANAGRGGSVATVVELDGLEPRWQIELAHDVTPPVVADGVLLVAEKDGHTVHAADARTGEPLWRYTAGGRIDSPPTVHRGRVLFGSADGRVYCLRLADGGLIWRFMAAPASAGWRRSGSLNRPGPFTEACSSRTMRPPTRPGRSFTPPPGGRRSSTGGCGCTRSIRPPARCSTKRGWKARAPIRTRIPAWPGTWTGRSPTSSSATAPTCTSTRNASVPT